MTINEKFTATIAIVEALAMGEEIDKERVDAVIEFLAERRALAMKASKSSRPKGPKPEKLAFYELVRAELAKMEGPVTARVLAEAMSVPEEPVTPAAVRGALSYLTREGLVQDYPAEGKSGAKTYAVAQ